MPSAMQEASITAALVALRVRTIREDRAGLEHVEALLRMRGHNLGPVPRRHADAIFHRGELRKLIRQALRRGPLTLREVSEHVGAQRPDVGPRLAYKRASSVLSKMAARGELAHEGRMWRWPRPAAQI